MRKGSGLFVFLTLLVSVFTGCAVTSSGNLVGEASATRFSSEDHEYRFAEVGMTYAAAGAERTVHSPHRDIEISGLSLNLRVDFFSYNYSILGQKGGVYFSVPLTIPLDVGIRSSFVQWVGPLYLGAGVSFVGGFYPNEQEKDYEPKARDSFGRIDGFILYNIALGSMFDVGEKIALSTFYSYFIYTHPIHSMLVTSCSNP